MNHPPETTRPSVGVAAVRNAIQHVQDEIDTSQAQLARGPAHCPSWRFPCACGSDLDVDGIMKRFAYVGPDPRHAMVAKVAMLEMLVDRLMLLSSVTLHRFPEPGGGDTSAVGWAPRESMRSSPEPVAAFVQLCQSAVQSVEVARRLASRAEGLAATVEERERDLAEAGEKIVLLQQVLRRLDPAVASTDPDDGSAPAEGWDALIDKIERAARSARTNEVLAATQVPFGRRNAGCMTEPTLVHPACRACAGLRAGVARVANTIAEFGLGVPASGPESPLECNELCAEYLTGHAGRLAEIVAARTKWESERAELERAHATTRAELAAATEEVVAVRAELAAQRDAAAAAAEAAERDAAASIRDREAEHARALSAVQHEAAQATQLASKKLGLAEAEACGKIAVLEAKLSSSAAVVDELKLETAGRTAAAATAAQQTTQLRAEVARLQTLLTDVQDRCADAEARVAGDAADQEIALAELRGQCGELEAELVASRAAAAAAEAGRASATAALASRTREFEAAAARHARDRDESTAAAEVAAARLSEAEAALVESKAERAAMAGKLEEAERWLDKASTERKRLLRTIGELSDRSSGPASGGLQPNPVVPKTPRPPTGAPNSPSVPRRGSRTGVPSSPASQRRADTESPPDGSRDAPPSAHGTANRERRKAAISAYLTKREH